jgi:hypothetical protein
MNPISDEIKNAVDGAAIAAGQACRETDPAIALCTDVERLPAARIDRITANRGQGFAEPVDLILVGR